MFDGRVHRIGKAGDETVCVVVSRNVAVRIGDLCVPGKPVGKRVCEDEVVGVGERGIRHQQQIGTNGRAYNTFPTMTQSLISHFRMMRQLGRRPQPAMAMQ